MTEVFRRLREDYSELQKLYDDVYPQVFAKQDWKGNVFARRTLDNGAQVELWYLAEHFLLAWNDWHGARGRYLAYFGQPSTRFPRSWENLHTRSKTLAEQMLRDERLDEIVQESWFFGPAVSGLMDQQQEATPRSVYHLLVTNHRRIDLLLRASTWEDEPVEGTGKPSPRKPVWPRCLDEAVQLNGRSLGMWQELPRKVREDCLWHLRQYRRANLLASWLVASSHLGTERPLSALLHVLNEEPSVHPTIEDFARRLKIGEEDRQTVNRLLHRVTTAIAEFGYEGFAEDVGSGDFLGGDDSFVGSKAVNVIPGRGDGHCHATLLAVSRGNKKGAVLSFGKIMTQVKAQLIDGAEQTRVVIFLCDLWSPDILDEHLKELRAHHRRDVRFLFLLVGTPDRVVAPVAVDLAAMP